MGEKKQKEKTVAQWKKFVVIGACVLFVVLMIVSGMGMGWISAFVVAKPGDVAVVDYTLYDAGGKPIVTTDQQVFKQAAAQGKFMLFSKQISLTPGKTLTQPLFPVQVYTTGTGWANQFAILAPEYNAMSSALTGMRVNEQKRIPIPSTTSMSQLWSADQLKRNGVSIDEINVGDILPMGVSDNPAEMATNSSVMTYIRVGEVTKKSPEGVVVEFGYPSVDIRVVQINGNN